MTLQLLLEINQIWKVVYMLVVNPFINSILKWSSKRTQYRSIPMCETHIVIIRKTPTKISLYRYHNTKILPHSSIAVSAFLAFFEFFQKTKIPRNYARHLKSSKVILLFLFNLKYLFKIKSISKQWIWWELNLWKMFIDRKLSHH